MKIIAAYLLATLAGNRQPNENDIRKIMKSASVHADEGDIREIIERLEGKDINEVMDAGASMLKPKAFNPVKCMEENLEKNYYTPTYSETCSCSDCDSDVESYFCSVVFD